MKVSKVNWAKCPYCNTTLNGYQFYPGHILMQNPSDLYSETKCSNSKCEKKIEVACKVEVTFFAEKSEEK